MKIKVSEATGPVLDWMVAYANGAMTNDPELKTATNFLEHQARYPKHCYQRYWAQGGPILTKAHISRIIDHSGLWIAYDGFNYADAKEHMQCDRSELVAGLRCFVANKLGEEVEVPDELA